MQPEHCGCGCSAFKGCRFEPFYTHQQIELPEIKMDVTHLIRKADALAERTKPDPKTLGHIAAPLLRQLVQFAKDPPAGRLWSDFYAWLLFTLSLSETAKTD